jgi:hypothetical protein
MAVAALVNCAVAIVVKVNRAILFFAVIFWFGAIALSIASEACADAVRFIEVMAVAALIDYTIAIVVLTIAADLVFVVIRWCWAIAKGVACEILANTMWFMEVVARAALIDHTIAIVVLTIAAVLRFAKICGFFALTFVIACRFSTDAKSAIQVMARTIFIDYTIAVIVDDIATALGFAVMFGFLAHTFVIACSINTDAVRFVEVIAWAALIDDTIAVIVEVIAAVLFFFGQDLTLTNSPFALFACLCTLFAYTYILCSTWACITGARYSGRTFHLWL